jgi:hypothetical protein
MMHIQDGAEVITADGKHAGYVGRIGVDAATGEVRDFVVKRPMVFNSDKVVAVELVAAAAGDTVRLRIDGRVFDALPDI